jgi:hypothetical protein
MLTTLVLFWVVWVVIFRNFTKSDDPDSLLKRSTRWLLRGSIANFASFLLSRRFGATSARRPINFPFCFHAPRLNLRGRKWL